MLALDKFGVIKRPVRANTTLGLWSLYDANLVGGSLVGVGMALSGACPGTVLVQFAQGIPSAQATALGALLGAALYIRFQELRKTFQPQTEEEPKPCRKTISDVFNIPGAMVYPMFGVAIAMLLRFTPTRSNQSLVVPVTGGLLIGCAQAVSLLLTHSPLGVSTVYEYLSRFALSVTQGKLGEQPSLRLRPVVFALGIIAGSIGLSASEPSLANSSYGPAIPTWQAVLGGLVMTFGARLGGGCTSGHGLSGLSAMSASSLMTVAAMFCAGILTRSLMR